MRRTLYSSVLPKASLAIVARTATANGTGVDLRYATNSVARSAMVVIHTGAITDGTHAITLEESDDNSAWNAVSADQRQGSLPSIVSTDDDKIFVIGYIGVKRFLRVVTTVTSATTGGVYGAIIYLGQVSNAPVTQA